jgi:hypothetical protein
MHHKTNSEKEVSSKHIQSHGNRKSRGTVTFMVYVPFSIIPAEAGIYDFFCC